MQRGLIYAVVDEADSVLIDDASSPLVLSFGSNDRWMPMLISLPKL